MGKPKVLLLGNIDHAQLTWDALSEVAELTTSSAKDRAAFLAEAKAGKLDGVVAAYRTFPSVAQTGLWDAELVDALPKSFKFIAHNGAGYDQLRPDALLARPADKGGPIIATNVPTAVDDATADTGIFLMLGALRNFNTSIMALRRNAWRGETPPALGHDPQGKLIGILGMGGIGRNFANKARAFGMRVAYHNRRELDAAAAAGATYLSFDELLAQSDVILVSVPLSPATHHLISTAEFAKMKTGVVVVNTARGAVIDEAALVKALDDGKVGSAGLDVFEEEPKVHPGLVANDKVLLLPHMGTWTKETQTKMEEWCIGNVRSAVEGKYEQMSVIGEHKEALAELSK
ncbi:hypothetical protein FH972_022076 [Carpinus fangiana]|uniref:D-isomer specific 2-hydroxyacid dehydrogenase NAD-binding domain-containing protein n=1 Tax=Carpinus fangiana TaxID=176857 RepID=A0A5N6KRJ2_9ROSI|nr:hypothetical protein FH972_022076 [Carpinus fangiana]